jgi:hypothetical protein
MFVIKSTRAITWPELSLRKGENTFPSRKAVPANLWPKLDRFRDLKLLEFEGNGDTKDEPAKLEELTQRQLFDMNKADLLELAKASGVEYPSLEPSKKELLDALTPKAKPLPKLDKPATEGEAAPADLRDDLAVAKVVTSKRGRGEPTPPVPVSPVSVT